MIRALRNTLRLIRIGRILARHDALFPLELLPSYPILAWIARRFARKHVPGRPGERLAAALHEMGPSFIKLGQTLATRSDLIGEAVSADLSHLQDRLPPFPSAQARATIETELEQPIDRLFTHFDDTPVAAASISQVHYAETAEGGKVAVKVLRPGIEQAFARDLDLFAWVAELVERTQPQLRRLKPRAVVAAFAATVRAEMDLRFEAAAADELAANFTDYDGFRVPVIDWQRTARRVLTLERIEGHRIDDIDSLVATGQDPDLLLKRSAEVFFLQVFRDGFFHADMHPGNMFVDEGGVLRPVDFGIMGRLDVKTRYFLADMMVGFLNGDYRRVAEVHFQAGYVPADQSLDDFTQACRSIGAPILGRPLHEISVARLLAQLFQITEDFQMETQPQLLLLQKTMLVAEGVGRRLNPTLNMWELARPLIEGWMRAHRGPEARIRQAALDVGGVIERLPTLLAQIERAADRLADPAGVKLHPDTAAAIVRQRRSGMVAQWPLWLGLGLVLLIAILS
ncbi:MAG: 2-polyprenylphenol 6-hydroxylase [Alphaproteobacteria bacterium]|nr:2-polyprenylphenol 6-hydroxylase [Alphaproteobacteria bacterium]MBU0886407.1 2-polyprenylphenol 6-hydroxylase [Alphaproteobacteria bacterium]MBU1813397.1 2-polyprenylphenol 6-hydroxylase [Alphaproteobacteria bacterium]